MHDSARIKLDSAVSIFVDKNSSFHWQGIHPFMSIQNTTAKITVFLSSLCTPSCALHFSLDRSSHCIHMQCVVLLMGKIGKI